MRSIRPVVSAFLLLAALQFADRAAITGDWANPAGSVTVRITACGAALCGHVIEASEAARIDALRAGTTTLIGTEVLTGFLPTGPDRWRGTVFVPDKRLTTGARIVRLGPDELELIVCDWTGLICRAQTWNRSDGAR